MDTGIFGHQAKNGQCEHSDGMTPYSPVPALEDDNADNEGGGEVPSRDEGGGTLPRISRPLAR
jgi:hypothetical protein